MGSTAGTWSAVVAVGAVLALTATSAAVTTVAADETALVTTTPLAVPEAPAAPAAAEPLDPDDVASVTSDIPHDPELPADSGEGRRVVFSQSEQHVWIVGDDGLVQHTYPVSGSIHDNLQPGTYEVGPRFREAVAYDGSGTMEYFVQFTTGVSEPIGFHTIPRYLDGTPEQTEDQLGTPLSAGCVRQSEADALVMWEFAQTGTIVVVTP